MRIFVIIILAALLAGLGIQVFFSLKERNKLENDLANLNERVESLSQKNADLESDIEYFSHPENLEKELKSKFNYKKPGEKMLIIVP